jgi:outer membrane protein OmpA-like peptidoglycan-associated protein
MKRRSLGLVSGVAVVLAGCGASSSSYVASDTTLGKVVIYRNGVAYFERYAEPGGGSLKLSVPDDKVDDFLKSLSVVDAQTGEPAPVSYPASATNGTVEMKVALGAPGRKLRISYVTEAPSWKSSYRVVVGKGGKVDVQGWAIVDNTSGEDWSNVKLGVGSSSAMSFRFNLKTPMLVQRETLRSNDLFATAPPTGGAPHGSPAKRVFGDLDDDALAKAEVAALSGPPGAPPSMPSPPSRSIPSPPQLAASNESESKELARRPAAGSRSRAMATSPRMGDPADASGAEGGSANAASNAAILNMARTINASPNTVFHVEGYASSTDPDKQQSSLARANRLREQLVGAGVNPNQLVAVARGEREGRRGGARVVEAPEPAKSSGGGSAAEPSGALSAPVGTSHFESGVPMSVPKATSAMVSVLRSETEGEVVYLYDPDGARGNAQFPFRTLRFKNPTENMLESGPVTVYGEGRFIGEGLAEPIPSKSVAFVPFALDRQVVVEREHAERDAIARIVTVQRGVFSTEIQYTKQAKYTLFNRSQERVVVYLRHNVPQGFTLTKSPEGSANSNADERLGATRLFRVVVEPNGKKEVIIEQATPVLRSTDIRTDAGRDLVRAYLSSAAIEGPLKAQVSKLLEMHTEMTNIESKIATLHDQMKEQRQRMDELHSQIFTLKAVKSSGPLMAQLERMLSSISDDVSKSTIEVVKLQESLMLAKIRFQTGVGQLTLEPPPQGREPAAART